MALEHHSIVFFWLIQIGGSRLSGCTTVVLSWLGFATIPPGSCLFPQKKKEMATFEDWVDLESTPAQIKRYRDNLLGLGVTRDTFKRDAEQIVEDFVDGCQMPRLIARDTVASAVEFFQADRKKRATPMMLFWDMENIHVPSWTHCLNVAMSLQAKLAPFGRFVRQGLRIYAGSNHHGLTEDQRSQLQLSGVLLIDTPHMGRKEVADKMIIVDAMSFAYEHPEGASLVFISGDTDFAYMFRTLERNPNWRTTLISNAGIRDVLLLSATHHVRWSDIVGFGPSLSLGGGTAVGSNGDRVGTPLVTSRILTQSINIDGANAEKKKAEDTSVFLATPPPRQCSGPPPPYRDLPIEKSSAPTAATATTPTTHTVGPSQRISGDSRSRRDVPAIDGDDGWGRNQIDGGSAAVPSAINGDSDAADSDSDDSCDGGRGRHFVDEDAVSAADENDNDLEVIRCILDEFANRGDRAPLKAEVGALLQKQNPIRYATKEARAAVFQLALHPVTGICDQMASVENAGHPRLVPRNIMQRGDTFESDDFISPPTSTSFGPAVVSNAARLGPSVPDKLRALAHLRPYFTVVAKSKVPTNFDFKDNVQGCYVINDIFHLYLCFRTLVSARRVIMTVPFLEGSPIYDTATLVAAATPAQRMSQHEHRPRYLTANSRAMLSRIVDYVEHHPNKECLKTAAVQLLLKEFPGHSRDDRDEVFAVATHPELGSLTVRRDSLDLYLQYRVEHRSSAPAATEMTVATVNGGTCGTAPRFSSSS